MNGVDDIIRRLETEANQAARDFLERQSVFQKEEALARMEVLIDDLAEAIDERGEATRLATLGVRIKETYDGTLWFLKGNKKLAVKPQENMSVKVGRTTIYPNRDMPIFDDKFYTDVMDLVFVWAKKT